MSNRERNHRRCFHQSIYPADSNSATQLMHLKYHHCLFAATKCNDRLCGKRWVLKVWLWHIKHYCIKNKIRPGTIPKVVIHAGISMWQITKLFMVHKKLQIFIMQSIYCLLHNNIFLWKSIYESKQNSCLMSCVSTVAAICDLLQH